MGGHGGLNILPQKSWNVYGQKNRQKVAEDEAERDKKEAKVQSQHERATRELRLRALRASLPDAVRLFLLQACLSLQNQYASNTRSSQVISASKFIKQACEILPTTYCEHADFCSIRILMIRGVKKLSKLDHQLDHQQHTKGT
jgi:hypothetical protein